MKNCVLSLMLLGAVLLAGCESVVHLRGNYVEEEDIEKIEINKTTRQEVHELLGPPSHVQMFDGAGWYYIGEKTQALSFFKPEVLERILIFISFDKNNIVSSLVQKDSIEGFEFDVTEEKTPTLGRDPSFFKEIFGSIGKYDEGKHKTGYV